MLEVRDLSKTFRAPKKKKGEFVSQKLDPREDGKWFHAVQDLSFDCKPGEILGLLGMNGAGKTTTLRMLATAIKPTKGTAVMDGVDITKDAMEFKRRIGFLSGSTGLYGRLTAEEMIVYYGRLHGVKDDVLKQRMSDMFDLLDMRSFVNRRNDNLSTGMKQKVSIVRTVIHDPPVLFFDEPTSGLDVLSAETIVNFIQRCKERGKTIIFSTHYMEEVEKLCDRVTVIHHGRNFYSGKPEKLKEQQGVETLEQAFKNLVKGVAA